MADNLNRMKIDLKDYTDTTLFSLIEEIQKRSPLYDIAEESRSKPEFVTQRNDIWEEISAMFGLPQAELRSLWFKLRCSFTRYFKLYQQSKGSEKVFNPNNWKFFDSLLFLIPYIKVRLHTEPQAAAVAPTARCLSQLSQSSISGSQAAAKRALKKSKTFLLQQNDPHSKEKGNKNERLIEELKKRPAFWNILGRKPTKAEQQQKLRAFDDAAEEAGQNVKSARRRWYHLYCRYNKGYLPENSSSLKMMSFFMKSAAHAEKTEGIENSMVQEEQTTPTPTKRKASPVVSDHLDSSGVTPSKSKQARMSATPRTASPIKQVAHVATNGNLELSKRHVEAFTNGNTSTQVGQTLRLTTLFVNLFMVRPSYLFPHEGMYRFIIFAYQQSPIHLINIMKD